MKTRILMLVLTLICICLRAKEEGAGDSQSFAVRDDRFNDRSFAGTSDTDIGLEQNGENYSVGAPVGRPGKLQYLSGRAMLFGHGAVHTLKGRVELYDYWFNSDKDNPLQFQVNRDIGYVYLRGTGTVTFPDGRTVKLPLAGEVAPIAAATAGSESQPPVPNARRTAAGPTDGRNWAVPDFGMEMIWIAPGTFLMGSEGGEKDERPLTRVTISRMFWLGRTEVTQAQWEALMRSNPSQFGGDDRPVENVEWKDAMRFCQKLTGREQAAGRLPKGFVYTLPTEAQWEYACRAGTTGDHAGDIDAMGWHKGNSDNETHPVGQKQANAWGLYDMHGNVWEWCLDRYGNYPGGSVRDPERAASGSGRVVRGGGWRDSADGGRSANRDRDSRGWRWGDLGFRLALSSGP